MAKVRASLKKVRTAGCVKPNCKTSSRSLNRHHIKHQAMWLGIWASKRRGEEKWLKFRTRYFSFNKADVRYLCASHHAEIHSIYDEVIAEDIAHVGRSLYDYTWAQAEALMEKLEQVFFEWVKTESKGISSKYYDRVKKQRREAAKKRYGA